MLINQHPIYGVDYWIGDVLFTRTPGSFLSDNIVKATHPKLAEAGELLASHAGLVESHGTVVEAWVPDVRRYDINDYFSNQDTLVWFKRPLGQTQESAMAMAEFMASKVGEDYDESALIGLALSDKDDKGVNPNWFADDDEWFCSELVTQALLETEHLRTAELPNEFKKVHPTWRTPQGLNMADIWMPGRIKGKPPRRVVLAELGGKLTGV